MRAKSSSVFYRWRIRYGGVEGGRGAAVEGAGAENSQLKEIVAQQALGISLLRATSFTRPGPVLTARSTSPAHSLTACRRAGTLNQTGSNPGASACRVGVSLESLETPQVPTLEAATVKEQRILQPLHGRPTGGCS